MKKIINLLFYLFILFLILNSIWPFSKKLNFIFAILFIILDIIIFIKSDRKKIKIDSIDIILGLLPIAYFIPYIFKNNVYSILSVYSFLSIEISLTFTLLLLRRHFNKERVNTLLTILIIISTISFFISILSITFPKQMLILGIYSYFGDTYVNSIYRFYGIFNYCNSSALFFIISVFISLFKLKDNKNDKYFFMIMLFINILGFLFTFSKMLTLAFIIVLFVLLVYYFLRKKRKGIEIIVTNLGALFIPSLVMVYAYRTFLINCNLLIFLFSLVICLFIYFLLEKGTTYLYQHLKIVLILTYLILFIIGGYFLINPKATALKINNVSSKKEIIISDFILEKNKNYIIQLNMNILKKSNVQFSLCKLYLDNLYPREEIIQTMNENTNLKFSFTTEEDAEYYYIKATDLNSSTDISIKSLYINDEEYLINSLIVPYQYVHQLELIKYDKESVSHRINYYKDSLQILKNNGFILGQGVDTFSYYASQKEQKEYLETNPHSYFFQLWLDVGIYGVIYVLSLIVLGISNMWKNRYGNRVVVWFCIFSLCMIVLPFDCIFSLIYFKTLLMLSFIFINDTKVKNSK